MVCSTANALDSLLPVRGEAADLRIPRPHCAPKVEYWAAAGLPSSTRLIGHRTHIRALLAGLLATITLGGA